MVEADKLGPRFRGDDDLGNGSQRNKITANLSLAKLNILTYNLSAKKYRLFGIPL